METPGEGRFPLISAKAARILHRAVGGPYRLSPLSGDASTRRFYRARGQRRAVILMAHSEPLAPSSPIYSNHRVFSAIGAPVPPLIGADDPGGLIIVGDLGDLTLQRHLLRRKRPAHGVDPARRRLYRQACDLIVLMHREGVKALREDDFAAGCALDRDRLSFEFRHFHDNFIGTLRGMKPGEQDEKVLRSFYDDLAEVCDRLPRVYCHRDFQSRNLMVRRGRLHLIDFQDARIGPYTYDTASLLRDSSLDIEENLVEEMIDYLIGRLGYGAEEFRRDFDLMALQRNIKDLGTFAHLGTARNRGEYLEYIPRTIASIRRTLLRRRDYHIIFPVLEKYLLSYTP